MEAVSHALGQKGKAHEQVAEALERSLQWRAGDTAAEDYMNLCQSGALDEVAGPEHDEEEFETDTKSREEQVQARVKAAKSITSSIRKIRKRCKGKAQSSASAPASGPASVKRKPVRFESEESWTAEGVQHLLPHLKFGYRAMKDHYNKCFRVIASQQRWSTSKSWGASGKDSVCVKWVLEKAWERHLSLHPDETCPWTFDSLTAE